MSSQKTQNYDLNQWLPADSVLRTDFNADNAKIDAAMSAMSEQVVQKANQSALDTLITAVNQKAGQDDLTALEGTVAGHTTQLAQKGNCRIYTTTYTGTGTTYRSFTFPQSPLIVVIGGPNIYIVAVKGINAVLSTESGECNQLTASWSGAGLTLSYAGNSGGGDRRVGNTSGNTYRIIALMDTSV